MAYIEFDKLKNHMADLHALSEKINKDGVPTRPNGRPAHGSYDRVYGGDEVLIHIKDGTRKDFGEEVANFVDMHMRMLAIQNGLKSEDVVLDQDLCAGCYMIAIYNAAIMLAERNKQSLVELGQTMAAIFADLADRARGLTTITDPRTEEIHVLGHAD